MTRETDLAYVLAAAEEAGADLATQIRLHHHRCQGYVMSFDQPGGTLIHAPLGEGGALKTEEIAFALMRRFPKARIHAVVNFEACPAPLRKTFSRNSAMAIGYEMLDDARLSDPPTALQRMSDALAEAQTIWDQGDTDGLAPPT